MQHYRMTTDGRYHLHEGLPTHEPKPTVSDCVDCGNREAVCAGGKAHARGVSCKTLTSLHTMHERIALAYYEDSLTLATHGSPEGMLLWAAAHNAHSPHKVKLYSFPANADVEEINTALLIPAALRGLLKETK